MTHHETQNDIWVFAEQRNGVLHGVSLELLGKARELAKQAGSSVGAILLGERKRVRMFAGLIKGQADVSAYAERLLDEDYEVTGR